MRVPEATIEVVDSQHEALVWAGAGNAIELLRRDLEAGREWYPAVLDAIARWDRPQDTYDDRIFTFLIEGEAFDWLALVERFYAELGDLMPEEEVERLLFHGQPPGGFDEEVFREAIGPAKYRTYLNYYYGIVVEEALNRSVEERVRKDHYTALGGGDRSITEEMAERIYGIRHEDLLLRFRAERGLADVPTISQTDYLRFTYWRFKLRLKQCIGVKVAADTKRGLDALERLRGEAFGTPDEDQPDPAIDLAPWSFRVVGERDSAS